MTILVAKKSGVLAVPSSAIINQNNNQYVRVVDDVKKGLTTRSRCKPAYRPTGDWWKLLRGLSEGQTVVTYIKQ